jgi:hypothetical protein
VKESTNKQGKGRKEMTRKNKDPSAFKKKKGTTIKIKDLATAYPIPHFIGIGFASRLQLQ